MFCVGIYIYIYVRYIHAYTHKLSIKHTDLSVDGEDELGGGLLLLGPRLVQHVGHAAVAVDFHVGRWLGVLKFLGGLRVSLSMYIIYIIYIYIYQKHALQKYPPKNTHDGEKTMPPKKKIVGRIAS